MINITKDTTLGEILKHPGAEEILRKYKLPCLSCSFAKMEMDELKIGGGCEMYGIDIKGLLRDLNNSPAREK
jgi:hybrid cluster-associated redox disulfide protein